MQVVHLLTSREILQAADKCALERDVPAALERLLDEVNAMIAEAPPAWTYRENLVDVAEYLAILIDGYGPGEAGNRAAQQAAEYRRTLLG